MLRLGVEEFCFGVDDPSVEGGGDAVAEVAGHAVEVACADDVEVVDALSSVEEGDGCEGCGWSGTWLWSGTRVALSDGLGVGGDEGDEFGELGEVVAELLVLPVGEPVRVRVALVSVLRGELSHWSSSMSVCWGHGRTRPRRATGSHKS